MLVLALTGWPDACEAATRAVRELTRLLPSNTFASIDAEEFYDFSVHRPLVLNGSNGNRKITWPINEFHYWRASDHGIAADRDIVVLLGVEPHLKWKAYRDTVMQVAEACKVDLLLVVGSLLAQVPHTRPPRVAGSASTRDLGPGLEQVRFLPPAYEGPSSMTSVIMEAMGQRGIPQISLWGQCPHYLQVAQNPVVCHAILRQLQVLVPVKLDLARTEREANMFNATIAKAIQSQTEIGQYVKRLEQDYDSDTKSGRPDEAPESGDIVKDLEAYLRGQRGQSDEKDGDPQR